MSYGTRGARDLAMASRRRRHWNGSGPARALEGRLLESWGQNRANPPTLSKSMGSCPCQSLILNPQLLGSTNNNADSRSPENVTETPFLISFFPSIRLCVPVSASVT